MGLMKRFDDPLYPGKRPKAATKIPGQVPVSKPIPRPKKVERQPTIVAKSPIVMRRFIEKIVGALGPGEERLFDQIYKNVNEHVTITRMHLQDLLIKLGYGILDGFYARRKMLVVEGGPIPEIEWTDPKPIMAGQGIFKHFNTYAK